MSVSFHILSLCFHILSLCFHILSLCFHILSVSFHPHTDHVPVCPVLLYSHSKATKVQTLEAPRIPLTLCYSINTVLSTTGATSRSALINLVPCNDPSFGGFPCVLLCLEVFCLSPLFMWQSDFDLHLAAMSLLDTNICHNEY